MCKMWKKVPSTLHNQDYASLMVFWYGQCGIVEAPDLYLSRRVCVALKLIENSALTRKSKRLSFAIHQVDTALIKH